jgi:ribosomal protein L44E
MQRNELSGTSGFTIGKGCSRRHGRIIMMERPLTKYEIMRAYQIAEAHRKQQQGTQEVQQQEKATDGVTEWRAKVAPKKGNNDNRYTLVLACTECPASISVVGNDISECCSMFAGWTRPTPTIALCPNCSRGALK